MAVCISSLVVLCVVLWRMFGGPWAWAYWLFSYFIFQAKY